MLYIRLLTEELRRDCRGGDPPQEISCGTSLLPPLKKITRYYMNLVHVFSICITMTVKFITQHFLNLNFFFKCILFSEDFASYRMYECFLAHLKLK